MNGHCAEYQNSEISELNFSFSPVASNISSTLKECEAFLNHQKEAHPSQVLVDG